MNTAGHELGCPLYKDRYEAMKHVTNKIEIIDNEELTVNVYGTKNKSADGSMYREIWFRDFDGKAGSTTIIQMPLSVYEKLVEAIKKEVYSKLCKEIERAEKLPFDEWERGRLSGLKFTRDLLSERSQSHE